MTELTRNLDSDILLLNPRRVLIGIGLLALVVLLLIVKTMLMLQEISIEIEQLYRNQLLPIAHVKEADNRLFEIERNLSRAMVARSMAGRSEATKNILASEKALRAEIDQARKGIARFENIKRLSRFEAHYAEYSKNVHHALAIMETRNVKSDQSSDYALVEQFQQVVNSADKLLDEIVTSKEEAAAETLQRAEDMAAQGLRWSLVIVVAAALAGLASVYYVKSAYVKPISRLNAFVDGLATGNTDAAAPFSEQPGNIGKLARSIDEVQAFVKAIGHRLRAQARISQAVPADIAVVLKLIVEHAADGPFDPSVLTAERQREMAHDFTQALSTGFAERTTWEMKLENVPQDLWVYKIDGKLAAFALILGLSNKQSLERELHAIAVDPAYRGQGIGSEILDYFCRHFAGRELYLQTKSGSTMMRLAAARGFSPFRKIGSEIFLKRPADFGLGAAIPNG